MDEHADSGSQCRAVGDNAVPAVEETMRLLVEVEYEDSMTISEIAEAVEEVKESAAHYGYVKRVELSGVPHTFAEAPCP